MCEKRTRKLKKGSPITRLREARRLQRLQRIPSPTSSEEANPVQCPPVPHVVDKTAQNRVLLELAWKTVALMHKNRIIQQKIVELQKETREYVISVLNHPENRKRYMEHFRQMAQQSVQKQSIVPIKTESDVPVL